MAVRRRKAPVAIAIATVGLLFGLVFSGCISTNQRASALLFAIYGPSALWQWTQSVSRNSVFDRRRQS